MALPRDWQLQKVAIAPIAGGVNGVNMMLPRVYQHTLTTEVGTDGSTVILVIHCYCVTNYLKYYALKQQTFTTSQFLWVRNLGMA